MKLAKDNKIQGYKQAPRYKHQITNTDVACLELVICILPAPPAAYGLG